MEDADPDPGGNKIDENERNKGKKKKKKKIIFKFKIHFIKSKNVLTTYIKQIFYFQVNFVLHFFIPFR